MREERNVRERKGEGKRGGGEYPHGGVKKKEKRRKEGEGWGGKAEGGRGGEGDGGRGGEGEGGGERRRPMGMWEEGRTLVFPLVFRGGTSASLQLTNLSLVKMCRKCNLRVITRKILPSSLAIFLLMPSSLSLSNSQSST